MSNNRVFDATNNEVVSGRSTALLPRFYYVSEPVLRKTPTGEMEVQTNLDGSEKLRNVECVEITIVGDNTSRIHRKVQESDKIQYAKAYKLWKEGAQHAIEGTPLAELPGIVQSQIDMLRIYNITAIEHLTGLDDAKLANLGAGARSLVARAQKWLADRDGASHDIAAAANVTQLQTDLAEAKAMAEKAAAEAAASRMALEALTQGDGDEEDAPRTRRGGRGRRGKGRDASSVEGQSPNAMHPEDLAGVTVKPPEDDDNPLAAGDGQASPQDLLEDAA